MSFIKSVVPMKDHRLFMEMESGSNVIVDLSVKLNTIKYKDLADEKMFRSVKTDGDYVIWGDGQIKVTVKELLDIVLIGEYPGQS
ncbi:MAG: DUF2442 domain-containing protein [Clostridiaceae bacterium]|nr:DUF2442 domain-containing protein [Clostridiaceae bacterium]